MPDPAVIGLMKFDSFYSTLLNIAPLAHIPGRSRVPVSPLCIANRADIIGIVFFRFSKTIQKFLVEFGVDFLY